MLLLTTCPNVFLSLLERLDILEVFITLSHNPNTCRYVDLAYAFLDLKC